ncbi:potassium channel NKT1 [Striga asiatica]|uniref:Potassium channel NKT1 n=1 Tax=Striga asiatica TaxID=4170 RepID=A0A5A7PMY9_STRAF|nr:potassium channel NKT1 [Striga asiatica]
MAERSQRCQRRNDENLAAQEEMAQSSRVSLEEGSYDASNILTDIGHMLPNGRMDVPLSICFSTTRADDLLLHYLLRRVLEPDELYSNNRTALLRCQYQMYNAASNGSLEFVHLLLDYSADTNKEVSTNPLPCVYKKTSSKDSEGNVSLWDWILRNDQPVIKVLINNGITLSSRMSASWYARNGCHPSQQHGDHEPPHNHLRGKPREHKRGSRRVPTSTVQTCKRDIHVGEPEGDVLIFMAGQVITVTLTVRLSKIAETIRSHSLAALLLFSVVRFKVVLTLTSEFGGVSEYDGENLLRYQIHHIQRAVYSKFFWLGMTKGATLMDTKGDCFCAGCFTVLNLYEFCRFV